MIFSHFPKQTREQWQFFFSFEPNFEWAEGKRVGIGLIKFKAFPEIGESIQRKHHRGLALSINTVGPRLLWRTLQIHFRAWGTYFNIPIGIYRRPMIKFRVW